MPDTWLAMLISLARRKPRVLGAEPGEEGAACSWKTVLWAWSASAAGGQGPETRGKEALPSPAPGTPEQGCPVCARAGWARAAAVPGKANTPQLQRSRGHLSTTGRQDGPMRARACCSGSRGQGSELRQREGRAGAGLDRRTNTDTVGREARRPGSRPTPATLPVSWSSLVFLASGAPSGLTHSPRQLGLGVLATEAWDSFPGMS